MESPDFHSVPLWQSLRATETISSIFLRVSLQVPLWQSLRATETNSENTYLTATNSSFMAEPAGD